MDYTIFLKRFMTFCIGKITIHLRHFFSNLIDDSNAINTAMCSLQSAFDGHLLVSIVSVLEL